MYGFFQLPGLLSLRQSIITLLKELGFLTLQRSFVCRHIHIFFLAELELAELLCGVHFNHTVTVSHLALFPSCLYEQEKYKGHHSSLLLITPTLQSAKGSS